MNLLRTFVAVRIPVLDSLRKIIAELAGMGSALKPARADDLHVTLKFLGDTDPQLVGDVGRMVEEAARSVAPFEVEVAGLGVFPHAVRPSIVWAGFQKADSLRALADDLESRLEPLGFSREQRQFEPHLTLARVKGRPPGELAELLARHKETRFGVVTIDAVVYFQSELRAEGPQYTPLATASLCGTP